MPRNVQGQINSAGLKVAIVAGRFNGFIVERLIDGPLVWAPSLRGGVVVSLRGGDFRLVCGRDASLGYSAHDDKTVQLYIEESFSAELNGPEAVVPLLPPEDPTVGDDRHGGHARAAR